MSNKFKYLSSIVDKDKDYPPTDIRSKLLNVLFVYGEFYKKYEDFLAKMPEQERKKFLLKLLNASKKNSIFGWHQFNDVLVEIEGYQYLVEIGCNDVEIIMEQGCPDIKGQLKGQQILLEAKQIHNSKEENEYLVESATKMRARNVGIDIPIELMQKINATIRKAKSQLDGYVGSQTSKKIIYMKIKPDLGVKLNNILLYKFNEKIKNIKKELLSEKFILNYQIIW